MPAFEQQLSSRTDLPDEEGTETSVDSRLTGVNKMLSRTDLPDEEGTETGFSAKFSRVCRRSRRTDLPDEEGTETDRCRVERIGNRLVAPISPMRRGLKRCLPN